MCAIRQMLCAKYASQKNAYVEMGMKSTPCQLLTGLSTWYPVENQIVDLIVNPVVDPVGHLSGFERKYINPTQQVASCLHWFFTVKKKLKLINFNFFTINGIELCKNCKMAMVSNPCRVS